MLRRNQVEALLHEATDQEVHCPTEMLLTHDEIEGALPITFHAVRELCRGYLAWLEMQPRPIEDAPKDRSRFLARTIERPPWSAIHYRWEEAWWSGSHFASVSGAIPECFIPLAALSVHPRKPQPHD